MASDGTNNGEVNSRNRRGSITQAALSNLFQRGSSNVQQGPAPVANDPQRRRLSVTTLGLSGAPANPPGLAMRRSSVSTNSNTSEAIDESAIEDDDMGNARTAPNTPFTRHMSFSTSSMRNYRPTSGSPGNDQQSYNWSEQLRTRAESSFSHSGARPSFSFASSPRNAAAHHDRAKSVSDMPQPPNQAPMMQPRQDRQKKPDAFQERILKGDFYMD